MKNADIARALDELADLLELRGENPFRVRAYRNGANAIEAMEQPLTNILAADPQGLQSIPGIGATIAEKCQVLVETGHLPQLEELRESTPKVLIKMIRIPGLGIKKALALVNELQIETLDDLRIACETQRVRALKGFAAKTEQLILQGLQIAEAASQRLRIWRLAQPSNR
jgi:DNA polymerase (family 10)